MDLEFISAIVILLLLVGMSAFFSGSETAFFSLNVLEQEKLRRSKGGKLGHFLRRILASPDDILITILTGNLVVNLFFASLMDRLVARFIEHDAWLYSIVLGTIFLLIFGEMTPKNIAIRNSPAFFAFSSRFLYIIFLALKPVRAVVKVIEARIVAALSGRINLQPDDSRRLIISTLQTGLSKGILHASELAVLESFLDFREKTADEIMIPRTELNGVAVDASVEDVALIMAKPSGKESNGDTSLLPVFKDDMDHIEGYLKVEDLLPLRFGLSDSRSIRDILNPVHAIPEKKNLLDLLREMIDTDRRMALVVDEYGGTAGIVTFQHLVEDFLGFFYPSQELSYVKLSEGLYRVPGDFDLTDLEALLETRFEAESRTLAGLIMDRLGEIPRKGKQLTLSGHLFTIGRVSRRRILEVEVRQMR